MNGGKGPKSFRECLWETGNASFITGEKRVKDCTIQTTCARTVLRILLPQRLLCSSICNSDCGKIKSEVTDLLGFFQSSAIAAGWSHDPVLDFVGDCYNWSEFSYPVLVLKTYKKLGSLHRPSVAQFIFSPAKSKPFIMKIKLEATWQQRIPSGCTLWQSLVEKWEYDLLLIILVVVVVMRLLFLVCFLQTGENWEEKQWGVLFSK